MTFRLHPRLPTSFTVTASFSRRTQPIRVPKPLRFEPANSFMSGRTRTSKALSERRPRAWTPSMNWNDPGRPISARPMRWRPLRGRRVLNHAATLLRAHLPPLPT
jgi:hypothetical protein